VFVEAFQRQLIEMAPRLRRLARALTRHAEDADDLVQIALERALLRRVQWQDGTRLDCWVMRIMKNAWIDEVRARTRKGRVIGDETEGLNVADPSQAGADDRTDALAVRQAMAMLPEDQRLAIALVLIEGLSYAEAADVLEVPAGTLTSRLVRGRAALMARLDQTGVRP
jgi:RNA polymerase sigma-70 factor (ECF subfamily)